MNESVYTFNVFDDAVRSSVFLARLMSLLTLRLSILMEIPNTKWVMGFMLTPCNIFSWFSPDPVCKHRGQTGVQQIPDQGGPALPLSVHLAVVHRQLQLRYCSSESFIPLLRDVFSAFDLPVGSKHAQAYTQWTHARAASKLALLQDRYHANKCCC